MAAFERPDDAVRAAAAIQRAVRERNREGEDPIDVGIGVSSGAPVMTDVDFIGHSVNLAQRLSAFAKGGQILVTEAIRRGAGPLPELRYVPLGPRSLRGLGLEDVVEVGWLHEVARVSDAHDRVTLILTEEGAVVVELAKDPKQPVRDGLAALRRASSEEDGPVSAFLQRAAGRLVERLLRKSKIPDVEREFALADVDLSYRQGTIRVRADAAELELAGVAREEGERFVSEAERLLMGGAEFSPEPETGW
jgi:hypothetical protein